MFGRKSEKRLIESPDQLDISQLFDQPTEERPAPDTEQITYTRKKQRQDQCVTDQGLRFDDSVPVEVIELPAPELQGEEASEYEVIDHKITRRLAQRPGSYVVLEYHRPVVKHKASQTLTTVAAPTAIFDNSLADVSLLAGILVDKFAYHLPLYRQHQRMGRDGIVVSRETLTNWSQKGIRLLEPIYHAQLRHILQSKTLSIDETPIKAGRKKKGKMQLGWYWPIYGEGDDFVMEDVGSRNGTYVNQKRIEARVRLNHNDAIQFGDAHARFDDPRAAPSAAAPARRGAAGRWPPCPAPCCATSASSGVRRAAGASTPSGTGSEDT